jgi:hypothetical protein
MGIFDDQIHWFGVVPIARRKCAKVLGKGLFWNASQLLCNRLYSNITNDQLQLCG